MTTEWPYLITARAAHRLGADAGRAAGSWVIDGNTTEETARHILTGYEDGDPAVLDMQPWPLSGEYADDWTPARLYAELDIDPYTIEEWEADAVCEAFETGYATGYWAEVCRAARYQTDD